MRDSSSLSWMIASISEPRASSTRSASLSGMPVSARLPPE